jgi:hypothetical protein
MKKTQPTRHLCDGKPARYTPSHQTDIRRTFRKHRLLAYLRQRQSEQSTQDGR